MVDTNCENWGLSAKKIEQVFRDSKELVCLMELGGRLSRVNSRWHDVLGWEEQELTTGPYIRFVHPDDVQKTLEYETHFVPTGFYNRWSCKDGTYCYLSWTGLSPIGAQGGPTFSIVRDVTLQIILQEERETQIKVLNDQLQFKNRVVGAIADIQRLYLGPLAILGPDPLEPVIRHFVQLTESELGVLIQNPGRDEVRCAFQAAVDPFDTVQRPPEQVIRLSSRMDSLLTQAVATHQPLVVDNTPLGNHASPLVTLLVIPLIVGNEVVGGLMLANRSRGYPEYLTEWLRPLIVLTTRLVHEQNLARVREAVLVTQKKAEDASEAKSEFLAHMSHELRTPLSSMISLLDLVNKDLLSETDCGFMKLAEDAGQSLLAILNDILDLSKLEARELPLVEINFNPLQVALDVTRLLSFQAETKGVKLKLQVDPALPETLLGDPRRLRQILLNLAGNAVKFTQHGQVTVSLHGFLVSTETLEDSAQPAQLKGAPYVLEGTVQDTGFGMSSEIVDGLFRAFSQGDTSISLRFGGTGLGLFICKQLCMLMGGNIEASSRPGEGSIFRFHVRMRVPENVVTTVESSQLDELNLPSLRVLVADDNPVNQLIMKTLLLRSGCASVVVASDGQQAVNAVREETFDLILMDVRMPVMDGLEATRQIRKHFDPLTLPIIGVTAQAMKGNSETALSSGMNSYIVKPITRKSLITEIRNLLPRCP